MNIPDAMIFSDDQESQLFLFVFLERNVKCTENCGVASHQDWTLMDRLENVNNEQIIQQNHYLTC